MKNFRTIAMTCAFALTTSLAIAQQGGAPANTAGDVEAGKPASTTPKASDTQNVRRARRQVPNQPMANTPGSQGNAHNIDNPRNGTNAEVAGSPAGTAEQDVNSAKAHQNSDIKK